MTKAGNCRILVKVQTDYGNGDRDVLDDGSRTGKDRLCDSLDGQTTWGNLNIRQ